MSHGERTHYRTSCDEWQAEKGKPKTIDCLMLVGSYLAIDLREGQDSNKVETDYLQMRRETHLSLPFFLR